MNFLSLNTLLILIYSLSKTSAYTVYSYYLWDQSIDLSGCQVSASVELVSFLCVTDSEKIAYISDIDSFISQDFGGNDYLEHRLSLSEDYEMACNVYEVVIFSDNKATLFVYTQNQGFETKTLDLSEGVFKNFALFGYYIVSLQLKESIFYLAPYNYDWNVFANNAIATSKKVQKLDQITSASDEDLFLLSYKESSNYYIDIYRINSPIYFNNTITLGKENCAEHIKGSDYLVVASCPSYNDSLGYLSIRRIEDQFELLAFQGSLSKAIKVGQELELIKKERFDLEEIILFSSVDPDSDLGFIGMINVYHDWRQYNFTYLPYDYKRIVKLDEVFWGYSLASTNNGDLFIASQVSYANSVAYTLLCTADEYYSGLQCYECSSSNYLSNMFQSTQCGHCGDVNMLETSMRERSMAVCDNYCGEYQFGKNCQPCESYKFTIKELAPPFSMWDNSQPDICTFKCAIGYEQTYNGCDSDGSYPYDNEQFLPNLGDYHTLFQCPYYTDCYNCTYNPQCQWCPSTFSCFNVSNSVAESCSDSLTLKTLDEPWYESQKSCTRIDWKCDHQTVVVIDDDQVDYLLAFDTALELNDFCSWNFSAPSKQESQYFNLEMMGNVDYAQLFVLDGENHTILSNAYFQRIPVIDLQPEIYNFVVYYRSNATQIEPPSFQLLVSLHDVEGVNKMAIYLPILSFFFLLAGIGMIVFLIWRYVKRQRSSNKEQPVAIFGQQQYRKYVIKNNPDKRIAHKIQKAFSKMEEVQFKQDEGMMSMMDDMGKCVICFKQFEINQFVRKMTSCIHMYHSHCLEDFIVNNINMDQDPKCPLCDRPMME